MTAQIYEEMVDFIARINPQEVSSFHASEATSERVANLLSREKNAGLTAAEKTELDAYLQLEHIMRLAKARAKQILTVNSL